MRKRVINRRLAVAVIAAAFAIVGLVYAAWTTNGTGNAYAKAGTSQALSTVDVSASTTATLYPGVSGDVLIKLDNPNPYAVTVTGISGTGTITADAGHSGGTTTGVTLTNQTGRSVTVSGATSNLPDGTAIASYTVRRYDTNGNVQTIGSGCSGTITALTCTETAVPGGTWKYAVTPVRSNWTGTEGPQSASVTVASPSLTFSSSTSVTSLPTTLNGTIAAFVGGQTVTFRLDNASTGTVLSGTLSPTPVPSGGGSSVTVTVPSGTSNGSHTVYAIGSAGDVASASITVSA